MIAELTNTAFLDARPGKSAELGVELLMLVAPTRREPGCRRYEIHQSNDHSNAWLILEDWLSAACINYDVHRSDEDLSSGVSTRTGSRLRTRQFTSRCRTCKPLSRRCLHSSKAGSTCVVSP
jgi:quinol monooxygenase YgiN